MSRHVRALVAGITLVALGCGSGKGDPPEPVVYADTTYVELEFREDDGQCAQVGVELRPWYEDAGIWYEVTVVDEGAGIAAWSDLTDSQSGTVSLCPRRGLTPGTHVGTARIELAWFGEAPVKGGPIRVEYRIVVLPIIRVEPGSLNVYGEAGLPERFSVAVDLPDGVTEYDVTMFGDVPFLRVVEKTASLLTVEAIGVARGTYVGWVNVTNGDMAAHVYVRYDVGPRPLRVSPQWFHVAAASGTPAQARVDVQLPDDASTYTLSAFDAAWVTVTERADDHFTIELTAAAPGEYRAEAWVTAGTQSQQVVVYYDVAPTGG